MNATTIHSSEVVGQLVLIETDPIRQRVKHAIAGFLAGYSGTTLEAYRLDLRGWITWLDAAFLDPFAVERAHIELCARWCESEGKARSTIGRRLSTIFGFYKYRSQERLIERDPSAHVRRPRQDYGSSTLGLDRNELGAFLVQAGLCGGRDHALACLLALNGLRISEALGADIENPRRQPRTPHPVHPSQRQQDRRHPAVTADRTGARSLHRRTRARADLHEPRRHASPGSACVRSDREKVDEGRWHRQADQPALAAPQLHHRSTRRRSSAPRRPRSSVPFGSANDDAL